MILLKLLKLAILTYIGLVLVIYAFQRHLLYHPQKYDFDIETSEFNDFEEVKLSADDGEDVYIWHKKPEKPSDKTIIYFHGNADSLPGIAGYLRLYAEAGFNVIGVEYRGYGKSKSRATERGILEDARAVIEYAESLEPDQKIILFGHSLGTGAAVKMATEYDVAGVVLHSPYTSLEDIAQKIYPYLPIKPLGLMFDKFDSLAIVQEITAPMLFIVGANDTLIPEKNSQILFEKATARKAMIKVEQATHWSGYDEAALVAAVKKYFSEDEKR